MPPESTSTVSVKDLTYVEHFTSIAAAAFANDFFVRRFIAESDSLQAGAEITLQRRIKHFLPIVKDSAENGAKLVEAGGWVGIALW
jgi:hypothetical protein